MKPAYFNSLEPVKELKNDYYDVHLSNNILSLQRGDLKTRAINIEHLAERHVLMSLAELKEELDEAISILQGVEKVKSIADSQDTSKLTLKQIKMKYKDMKRAAEAREVEKAGETNCYVCTSCKHVDKYVYADSGTTSFINNCSKCGGSSQSEYGQNNYPELAPTMEWYRPSLNHVQLMQGRFPAMLDHVLNGGLVPREITKSK